MKPEKETTGRKRKLIGLGIILAGLLLGGFTWYLPVSYTHLDVYKRQHPL